MIVTAPVLEKGRETCQGCTEDGRYMSSVSAHECIEGKVGGALC